MIGSFSPGNKLLTAKETKGRILNTVVSGSLFGKIIIGGFSRFMKYGVSAVCFSLAAALLPAALAGAGQSSAVTTPPLLSASEIDYPPFSIVDDKGRADGFSVELLRAALSAMGRQVTFRTGAWAPVRTWLEKGEIQALPLVGRTPERELIFDFSFAYMSLHGAIVVRNDTTDVSNLYDLAGRRVAVMKGDNAEEFLRREKRGIIINTTSTFEEALHALSAGRSDAVVIQRLVALRLIQETGLPNLRIVRQSIEGFRQDFCFAVKEGDRETLALLNEGLALVMADGTYRSLHAKWFAALELPSHRRLVIGGDHSYPPYEYIGADGRPAGYNVDLTRAIARETGLDIEIHLGPWTQILQGLENGEIDAVQGMFYSQERDRKFDFTQPVSVNHCVAVVRKGTGAPPLSADQLAGKRIVVQRGDIMHDLVAQKGLQDQVSAVDSQEAALRELADGRHDIALVSRLTALYWIEKHGWKNLTVGRVPLLEPEYGFAVADGQRALLAQLSEGLQIIEETGEYRRIRNKWMGIYGQTSAGFKTIIRYVAMVSAPLLLLLVASFLWSRSLRQQVANRTAQLGQNERLLAAIIDAIAAPVFYKNAQGIYMGCNQAFAKLLGLPKGSIIGKTAFDIAPGERARKHHEADLTLMKAGDVQVYEAEVVDHRGARRPVMFHKAPFYGPDGTIEGIVGAMIDISAHKLAEETLREGNSFIRAVLDNLPIGIAVNSVEPVIEFEYMNDHFPKIYRTTREALAAPNAFLDAVYKDPQFRQEIEKRVLEDCASGDPARMHWKDVPISRKGRETAYITARNIPMPGRPFMISVVWDVTERKRSELEREMAVEFLHLINESSATADLVHAAIGFFQHKSGCEAVGIRLKQGQDYPYYETQGFAKQFVALESGLCSRDQDGRPIPDAGGDPVLECMCGNVIGGRIDPSKPFFTAGGSFWTNSTTQLLATSCDADRLAHTRNRCNREGYESVALIGLRVGETRLGLLQLNDKQRGRFTPANMVLWEKLAGYLAVALSKFAAEEALRESEEQFRLLFEAASDGVVLHPLSTDRDGSRFVRVNAVTCQMLGYSPAEMARLSPLDIQDAADLDQVPAEVDQLLREGKYLFEKILVAKDGRRFPAEINTTVFELHGQTMALSIIREITGRKRDEARIRHLNRVLITIRDVNKLITRERDADTLIGEGCRLLVENRGYASALIVLTDPDERPVSWAQEGKGSAFGPNSDLLAKGQLPPCCERALSSGKVLVIDAREAVCDGCPRGMDDAGSLSLCVRLAHDGVGYGYLVAAVDKLITVDGEEQSLFAEMADDLAYALSVLRMDKAREASEQNRKLLENQLMQAQKMESVGRLAGGVAHDYNNMLSVIIGYAELAMDNVDPADPLKDDLKEILKAGRRSAEITRQLLAFARQQTIEPRVLDLNDTVEGMLKMLRRLIGEDIDLAWLPEPGLWPVKMDPSQIDQLLANLCVNARDAIAGVGKLTIETDRVTFDEAYCADHAGFVPGEFVLLAVSDDGCGMDKQTRDKIFDPYFTTKALGKGTGLGLATVYGIVKQNNGFINVYSEPKKGTTFKIYLPRHAGRAEHVEMQSMEQIPAGRGETVLIVEDEPAILKIGVKMLVKLGYQVLTANSPGEALRLAGQHAGAIDLLITDVVMPAMNGRELAIQLSGLRPDLKTLFMSGYTADVIAHRGVLDEGVNFIPKPLSMKVLAVKLRAVLDNGT
jgi:PAS domain S-box-containing protein